MQRSVAISTSIALAVAFAAALGGCGNAANGSGNGGDGGMNTAVCADPAMACGDRCVDLQNDPANCGSCDHACMAANVENPVCEFGNCTYDDCLPGFADCDGDVTNGCEQATATDVNNCGGCGVVCDPKNGGAVSCVNGSCQYSACAAGYGDCDGDASNGCETSLDDDNANCGSCGNVCNGGNVCAGGVCGLVCTGDLTLCGTGASAFCTITNDDPDNCGACGHVCTPMHVDNRACAQGQCGYHQCDTDYGDCDGDPTNGCETCLSCSTDNCGGCGIKCLAVHVTMLTCTVQGCDWTACETGWGNCDNLPDNGCETDITNDPMHCGAGCTPCTTGQTCVNGVCTP